jgi:hypothetical protein
MKITVVVKVENTNVWKDLEYTVGLSWDFKRIGMVFEDPYTFFTFKSDSPNDSFYRIQQDLESMFAFEGLWVYCSDPEEQSWLTVRFQYSGFDMHKEDVVLYKVSDMFESKFLESGYSSDDDIRTTMYRIVANEEQYRNLKAEVEIYGVECSIIVHPTVLDILNS